MGRFLGWIVAAAGLVALVLAGTWIGRAAEAEAGEAATREFVLPVTLTTLERGDLHPHAPLSGTVRAARRARLAFDTSGLIADLAVGEADRVVQGQVLAHLGSGDEENELAAAEAALALAEREYELLAAGEREEEKRRLTAVVEAAEAEAELAQLEVQRAQKLLADRIVSQSEQDQRLAEWRAADKRRAAADEDLHRAQAGSRPEDLAIAAARIDQARTRVASARHNLRKTELVAPWGGAVVLRLLSEGDYVSAGDPVFELVDTEHLEVHVEVPGRFAPHLGDSTRVHITIWRDPDFAIDRALDATIPAADDKARSFRAIVRPTPEDDPDHRLKPGMFVHVELLMEPVLQALVVPSDCVLANERGTYLVRAITAPSSADAADAPAAGEPGRHGGPPALVADFVSVRVIAQADERSAIESLGPPLAVGDSIVLVGADNAFPGAALLPRSPGGDRPGAPEGAAREGGQE